MPPEPSSSAGAGQQEPHQANENRDPEDDDLTEVPLHIQSVREGLLDFDHFLGLQAALLLAGESDQDDIPLSAYKPDAETGSQRAREQEFAESAQALVGSAKNADNWQEWKRLIREWMKERVDSAQEGGSMGQKSLDWVGWRLWKAHKASEEDSIPWTSPGLYLGFSMHDSNTSKGFDEDPSFSNYTLKNLENLSKHGLQCAPLFDDSFQVPTPCFPWAVFYIFGTTAGGKSTSEDSFYQSTVSRAAAAASTALSMLEGLAKFAEEKQDGRHIPPLIAVTIVGVKTTVWLAYCDILDERLRDHKMISLWEGNVTKIWDAIQFCRIIDNLLVWAQHCLKPMVTKYLDQWRVRYFPSASNIHTQLEKDTKTAKLIHSIQDRVSLFGISTNDDLPSLIRQAIVFQEVMKLSDKEVIEGSELEDEKKFSSRTTICSTDFKKSPLKTNPSARSTRVAVRTPYSMPELVSELCMISTAGEDTGIKSLVANPAPVKNLDLKESKTSFSDQWKDLDNFNFKFFQSTLPSITPRVRNGKMLSLVKQPRWLDVILVGGKRVHRKRKPRSADLTSNNNSPDSSSPFVSDIFQLSFDVTPWWDFGFDGSWEQREPVKYVLGPYPTLQLEKLEFKNDWYLRGLAYTQAIQMKVHLYDIRFQKRVRLTRQPADREPSRPPSQFKVKIPWRGKNIVVKLPPPVIPKPTSP